jgi:DNA-binding SARP family transcriptional activator
LDGGVKMNVLQVNMFGTFEIVNCDKILSVNNRSKKVWSLVAYLIYHRNRVVKQSELIDLIWGDSDKSINSTGALKTLLYRARTELDGIWEGAGKQLIVCSGDGYCWNKEYAVESDFEKFDRLALQIDGADLELCIEALKLYRGDFLDKMSSELWVMPITVYYHNIFIECVQNVVPRLIENGRLDEALQFCRVAAGIEPYNEDIHCLYMRACIASSKQKKAIDIYQKLSERLSSELGVIPSENVRALYHEAVKINNTHTISLETLQEQLREKTNELGALICEYDFFRVLYYSMARSVMRNGIAVHIALISAVSKDGEFSNKRREKVMANIEDSIRYSLRRGDSAAKCSATQYVIMLPRANYENSCMVCERILKAYYKKNARNDVQIRYEVCALEPDDKENYQWIK